MRLTSNWPMTGEAVNCDFGILFAVLVDCGAVFTGENGPQRPQAATSNPEASRGDSLRPPCLARVSHYLRSGVHRWLTEIVQLLAKMPLRMCSRREAGAIDKRHILQVQQRSSRYLRHCVRVRLTTPLRLAEGSTFEASASTCWSTPYVRRFNSRIVVYD